MKKSEILKAALQASGVEGKVLDKYIESMEKETALEGNEVAADPISATIYNAIFNAEEDDETEGTILDDVQADLEYTSSTIQKVIRTLNKLSVNNEE